MTNISSINGVNDGFIEHYTPTTEEVRLEYSRTGRRPDREAEFDRWFAEELRKAKAETWEEGYNFEGKFHENPYRQGETE